MSESKTRKLTVLLEAKLGCGIVELQGTAVVIMSAGGDANNSCYNRKA
jgi:hypothetical protein